MEQQYLESPQRSFSESDQGYELQGQIWDDLKKIIIEVGEGLEPNIELEHLSAAERAVQRKDEERGAITRGLQAELHQLRKVEEQAAASARRPNTVPSLSEHKQSVQSLEQAQYSTNKQLKEQEGLAAKREMELSQWKGKREEVKERVVGQNAEDGFPRALKLNLLDGCGFRYLPSADATKVVIRNDAKTDINTITVDKSRSKVYWANLMWTLAGE